MQKDNEESLRKSGSKHGKKDKKAERASKKLKLKEEKNHQRRRSSSEQPLRYRLSIRPAGYQQSHSVRNLIPISSQEERDQDKSKSLEKTSVRDEPLSTDRDHHSAVEFYNRSTPYSYTRESLIDLRKPYKQESRYHLSHQNTDLHRQLHSHTKRCKECLQVDCICMSVQKPPKSDWAILVQPELENKKTWTRQRLDWLEDLEDSSQGNNTKIDEEKFSIEREVCCFPFSTFRIFSKCNTDNTEYYKKN